MYRKVTRKAYLFGASGGHQNGTTFLSGVNTDLENVAKFLYSDHGGAFDKGEVEIIRYTTYEAIVRFLQTAWADYVLVYFSGHGFYYRGNNYLSLQDGSKITDKFLLQCNARKQMVITDSCRSFVDIGRIGAIPGQDEHQWINASGRSIARQFFDHCILNSQPGKQIINAVPAGYATGDTPNGGIFTNKLIDISMYGFESADEYRAGNIQEIVGCLQHPYYSQNDPSKMPNISFSIGNLTVPFAVGLPSQQQRSLAPRYQPIESFAEQGLSVDWAQVGMVTLLGFAVAGLFKD